VTDTVCDNTRALALAERGQEFKVKHSRYSRLRLADARAALQMIHTLADEFAAEIFQLCATPVSDLQFRQFLNFAVPMTDDKGGALASRSLTTAQNKRAAINKLYRYDIRCAPWIGTAHGVIQAINTYEHHENTVRGATRADRNMLRTVTGEFGNLDRTTWTQLNNVLAVTDA
jgi:phage/plasmid-like protein (TIGR03299 family)